MITLDDKYRLEDFGLRAYLEHEHEAVPEIRRKIMTIPGRPGAVNFGSEIGERHFNLPLKVNEDNQVKLRQKLREFVTFLFDEYASPRPIKLSFDYEPDKYYTVEVSSLVTPSTAVYHFLNFGLPLIASDPFAYSNSNAYDQEPIDFDQGFNYDEGHMYPNTQFIEWNYNIQYAGVHNHSHYATPLNFVIEGRVINPRITLNGKTTVFNVTLNADERLYVDSKTQQAWVTKIERDEHGFLTPVMIDQSTNEWYQMNLYNQVIGDFPMLKSGDNHMKFEGGLPQAIITFDWEHRFL